MKKYLKYIVIAAAVLNMSGCSSDDIRTGDVTAGPGTTVLVYPGDTVTPLSADTKVDVSNIYNDGYSSVTVITGSIKLTRG